LPRPVRGGGVEGIGGEEDELEVEDWVRDVGEGELVGEGGVGLIP
jgi:hypothetical protein